VGLCRSCRTEYCVEHESQQRYEQRGLVPFQTIRNYCQKIQQIRKKFIQEKVERVKGQAAPAPDRIGEIQAALAKSNSYDGVPTGKWTIPLPAL